MSIKTARLEIEKEIQELEGELLTLQEKCKHNKATKTCRGNTGNYDPTADYYWIEYNCPDCGKQWSVEQ